MGYYGEQMENHSVLHTGMLKGFNVRNRNYSVSYEIKPSMCAASKKPISNVFATSLKDTRIFSKIEKTALREE